MGAPTPNYPAAHGGWQWMDGEVSERMEWGCVVKHTGASAPVNTARIWECNGKSTLLQTPPAVISEQVGHLSQSEVFRGSTEE